MPAKKKQKKIIKNKKQAIAVAVLAVLILIIAILIFYISLLRAPKPNCNPEQSTTADCQIKNFIITEGTATPAIIQNLKDAGLIRSTAAFKFYLSSSARGLVFNAGTYKLSPGLSAKKLVEKIKNGPEDNVFTVTFLPGATITDAKKVFKKVGYTDAKIEAAFKKQYKHPLLKSKPENASLEGYIFGDTYEFFKGTSIESILKRTFDEMYSYIKTNRIEENYQRLGLSLHEGITLASVVQREAKKTDMAQVAQVFELRLKKDMPLGSDAIIAYRADQINPNRKKTDTSYLNTITCPWNSRQCTGLPPEAISNPGKEALHAVAHPANGSYLYFLTGDDGKMYYANTEVEHNENINKHCHEMCKIL